MGVICPIESPDNKDIGLTKHFAVLARVTERGVVQDDVRKCLVDLGMVVSRWATGTPVWLNGTPQGVISDPTMFCSRFRDLRRVGRSTPTFPSHGVLERIKSKSLAMRVVFRPILLCKDGKILFDKPSIESWSSLLPHVDTCYKRTGRSLRTRRSERTNQRQR
jgi:DNA-directed RNA polymerase beta subunit